MIKNSCTSTQNGSGTAKKILFESAENNEHPANDSNSFSRYLELLSPVKNIHTHNQNPSRTLLHQRTMEFVTYDILQNKLPATIRMMLMLAGVDRFLPSRYSRFKTVVMEGAVFILTSLPKERIVEKIVDQLVLPLDTQPGERILTLVKDMPTLHKLGQIIGRTPGIDPEFKASLVNLEDNISTITYDDLHKPLMDELDHNCSGLNLVMERNILAEASVCAVIAGKVPDNRYKKKLIKLPNQSMDENREKGPIEAAREVVFKIVKPSIKKHMSSELLIWRRLGEYLDANKERWGLGEFQFKGTIAQVSRLLENEVDLHLEQQNLEEVRHYYQSDISVSIPEKLSVSTSGVTVMTRLDGNKITDVDHLSDWQRRSLAKKVTRICILQPVIELDKKSIFHGDPHAGNIAYQFDNDKPEIIFYDWAMVGRLKRLERLSVILMVAGLVAGNATVIYYAADIMSGGKITADTKLACRVHNLVTDIIASRENRINGVLCSVEFLIEQIMYEGVVFSSDLLIFEKSLVTLKGVLADIDPTFDRDEYVVWCAAAQLASDIAHFRLQSMILKEIWTLYKYSLSLFLDIQKAIMRFGWEMVKA